MLDSDDDQELKVSFSFENQKVEESALFLLNNIETPSIELIFKKIKKEIKFLTQLSRGSELIGIGEFVIYSSVFEKKDLIFKKWCNILENKVETPKEKLNLTMNLINSIRIYIKANIQYHHLDEETNGKIQLESDIVTESKISPTKRRADSFEMNEENKISFLEKMKKNSKPDNQLNSLNRSQILNQNVSIKTLSTPQKNKYNYKGKNMSSTELINTKNNIDKSKINNSNLINNSSIINNNSKPTSTINSNKKKEYIKKVSKINGLDCLSSRNISSSKKNAKTNNKLLDSFIKQEETSTVPKTNISEENKLQSNYDHIEPIHHLSACEGAEYSLNNGTNISQGLISNFGDKTSINSNILDHPESKSDDSSSLLIDNIFSDEIQKEKTNLNNENIPEFTETFNLFQTYYNENYLNVLPSDSFYLQFEIKMLLDKFLELRDSYYNEYNQLKNDSKNFKKFFILYNEKYRLINKKINKIKGIVETNCFKNTLINFIDSQEIIIKREETNVFLKQINIFKSLLNLNFEKEKLEMQEYNRKLIETYQTDKQKFFFLSKKLFEKKENSDKLTDGQKLLINRILNKPPESTNKTTTSGSKTYLKLVDENDSSSKNKFSDLSKSHNTINNTLLQETEMDIGKTSLEGQSLDYSQEKHNKINNDNKSPKKESPKRMMTLEDYEPKKTEISFCKTEITRPIINSKVVNKKTKQVKFENTQKNQENSSSIKKKLNSTFSSRIRK
jgi:hypothetical protein